MQQQTRHKTRHATRSQPIREYFGHAEGCYLGIQERSYNFSVARIFGVITFFWRFTYDSRIENVGMRHSSLNKYFRIMGIDATNRKHAWTEGRASCHAIPDESLTLDDALLSDAVPGENYRALITKGIESVRRLITALGKPGCEAYRREHQLPLHDILGNAPLYSALELVSAHEPTIRYVPPSVEESIFSPMLHITYACRNPSAE